MSLRTPEQAEFNRLVQAFGASRATNLLSVHLGERGSDVSALLTPGFRAWAAKRGLVEMDPTRWFHSDYVAVFAFAPTDIDTSDALTLSGDHGLAITACGFPPVLEEVPEPLSVTQARGSVQGLPSQAPTLYPYQQQAVQNVEADWKGGKAPLVRAITAAGKTVIMAALVARHAEQHKNDVVLVIAPQRELIKQTSEKLSAAGVDHGLNMLGYTPGAHRVIVTTPDSAHKLELNGRTVGLILVDEAHGAKASKFRRVLAAYPAARLAGFTATPVHGLGQLFNSLHEVLSYEEARKGQYVVQERYFTVGDDDATVLGIRAKGQPKLKVKGGDFDQAQAYSEFGKARLVGDVVRRYLEYGDNRLAVVFACTVSHSVALKEQFVAAGISAAHIDGNTPTAERTRLIAAHRSGELRVLCNCAVAATGYDNPGLELVVIARPTASEVLWVQMVGRGLRAHPGKTGCDVWDHAGNLLRHGAVDAVEFPGLTLSKPRKVKTNTDTSSKPPAEPLERTCPACQTLYVAHRPRCVACGHVDVHEAPVAVVEALDGDLVQVGGKRARKPQVSEAERQRWFSELRRWQMTPTKGGKLRPRSVVDEAYEAKFKETVPQTWWSAVTAARTLSPEVAAYARSRDIRVAYRTRLKRENPEPVEAPLDQAAD